MHDSGPGFAIDAREEEGALRLVPRGELDLATAPELERVLGDELAHGRDVRLDLRELAFMDSSGVRVLVTAHRAAERGQGTLRIVAPREGGAVDRVLSIAGIADQLGMVAE
jgi:anti-anti-sigma factor